MSCTAICCLNLPNKTTPLSSNTKSSSSEPTPLSWRKNEASWKRQCIVGVAYMIIGLGVGNNPVGNENYAIAEERKGIEVAVNQERVSRWSEKRKCPPWMMNSLELVVPENLPRPYTPRRWESVRNYHYSKDAPAVRVVAKTNPRCFSM